MINWLLGNPGVNGTSSKDSDPIQGDFDFILETSPKIPETNSNLNILCYKNQSRRERVHVRVKWSRLKNGQLREIEGVRGNTYNCEPSDLGAKIRAEIISLDESVKGRTQVWFGPIKFDAGIKQSVSNILSKGKTKIGAGIYKGGKQATSQITLSNRELTFDIDKRVESFEYSLSDPRIEISSRDTTKVWIRFSESSEEKLNQFLGITPASLDMSGGKAGQRKIYRTSVIDSDRLLEVRFNNRSARDTFIFSVKSFCAEREMKSSLILERLQRLDLNQEELCQQFFEYESLKNDVVRLDLLNKELSADRDQKILDLRDMEEDVEETTRTYLKIINEKYKDKLDLNKSYSMLSHKHDDIQEKRSITTLKDQNRLLRARLLDLESEIEQLKSFNEQHQFNPQTSPFFKKGLNAESGECPDTIAKLNPRNLKLAAENTRIREKKERNILTSFQESETAKKDMSRRSSRVMELAHKMDLSIKEIRNKAEMNFQQSSIMGNSINTEAGMRLLQEKFQEIKGINERVLEENEKLLQEIEVYRRDTDQTSSNYKKQIDTLQKVYQIQREASKREIERMRIELGKPTSSGSIPLQVSVDNGEVLRLMEQLQLVIQEKQMVIRDIISLEGLYEQVIRQKEQMQRIIQDLEHQLNSSPEQLRVQNMHLINEVNFLQSQREQLRANQNSALRASSAEVQTKINTLIYQNQQLFADLNFVRNELQRCVSSLKQAEQDVSGLQQTIKSLKDELFNKARAEERNSKKMRDLQSELDMMKRSSNALNRSRDLSVQMSQYDTELIETLRKEMDGIIKENESYAEELERLRGQNAKLRRVK